METQIDTLQDEVKRLHEIIKTEQESENIREHCEKRFDKQSI